MKCASNPNQTKLTSFFDTVGKLIDITSKEPRISAIVEAAQEQMSNRGFESVSPLFNHLLRNAESNSQKVPKNRRHDEVIKKFATSLLIYAGPLTYNFLHQNMLEALPCRRTVQNILYHEYHPIQEGYFRFESLLKHLERYSAPKVVSIGEDATRVISRIDYDNETDCLVGFVLPCDEKAIPLSTSFKVESFEAMQAIFQSGEFAKYAFVYMAQPLARGVPAFCLACLGTNNKFTSEFVLKRWQYIYTECKKFGITVVSFGADGVEYESIHQSHVCK